LNVFKDFGPRGIKLRPVGVGLEQESVRI
jgi:hypothetical protein